MKRLVCSLFALALALSFNACEGHSVAALPEHYQHKLHGHHGDSSTDAGHEKDAKHAGETKDPNQKHHETPVAPEAKPVEAPQK